MDDCQNALHQVEVHAAHGRHAAEFLADQRLFGRAVHLHDADSGTHVVADCFGARKLRCDWRRSGAGAASVVTSMAVAVLVLMPVVVLMLVLVLVRMTVRLSTLIMSMIAVATLATSSGMLAIGTFCGFGLAFVRHGGFLVRFVV